MTNPSETLQQVYPCSLNVKCLETQVTDLKSRVFDSYACWRPSVNGSVFDGTVMEVIGKCTKCGNNKRVYRVVTTLSEGEREQVKQQLYAECANTNCESPVPCTGKVTKTQTIREAAPSTYFPYINVISDNEFGICDTCNRKCKVKSTRVDWVEQNLY